MTPPRFQVNLQRLLVAVALFALLFGGAMPFWHVSTETGLWVGPAYFLPSIFVPVGYAIYGWRGGLYGAFLVVMVVLSYPNLFVPQFAPWLSSGPEQRYEPQTLRPDGPDAAS